MGFADANQYLASRGTRSSKFDNYGDSHSGLLVDADRQIVTDTKGEVQFQKDGITPKEQLVLTWRTEERDSAVPGDDGLRKLYCSWRLEAAIKNAMRAAGGDGLEENARLTVTYTGEERASKDYPGKAKLYDVEYELPAKKLGSSTAAPAASTPAAAAVYTPPADKLQLAEVLFSAGQDISVVALATGIPEDYLVGTVFPL